MHRFQLLKVLNDHHYQTGVTFFDGTHNNIARANKKYYPTWVCSCANFVHTARTTRNPPP